LLAFGFSTIVAIPAMYRSSFFTNPLSSEEVAPTIPNIDLGSVNGVVTSSDGLPMSGAIVHVYKHMGLIDSADKNPGYSTSVITKSDGSYSFGDLPSGVYKFTVTYSDDVVQIIDNYAVWPSSSSSYIFKEYRSSTNPPSYDEVAPTIPNIDLGSVKGFVMSSDDLPVDGASVAVIWD
jgi:Carboxypeptidase regulatory-like domain